MDENFVADGESRLRESEAFQTQLRELRDSIETRYAAEIARAGLFRRLLLQIRIAIEFSRERKQIEPSPYSMYCRA